MPKMPHPQGVPPPGSRVPRRIPRTIALGSTLALLAALALPAFAESVSQARSRLAAAIQKKSFPEATSAVDSLIEMETPDAMEAMISVGLKGDYYGLEQYIGGRILNLPEGEAFERVCELASESPDSKARVLLTLVLGERKDGSANKAVIQNLFDKDDGVVLAALEKLVKKDDIQVIGHLIEALAHREKLGELDGIIAYEIRKLLLQLTHEDIVRVADWRNWWEPRKENFQRPDAKAPTKERVTSVHKEPPVFFGTEVPAEKIVFLLDVSLSMAIRDPAPEEIEDPKGEGQGQGGTSVPKPKEEEEGEDPSEEPVPTDIPVSRERLHRVKAELIQTIERLPEKTQFTIIIFNHQIQAFSEDLLPATDRNKQKAIEFVQGMQPDGETWTDHALVRAFETPGLRAIFLLSDGAPRRNEVLLPTEPILQWVAEANRFARVRIHTVGFEQAGKSMRKFLRAIAFKNNGKYTELR